MSRETVFEDPRIEDLLAADLRSGAAPFEGARYEVYDKVDPSALDQRGMSILSHAAKAGDAEGIQYLLDVKGCDPNVVDDYGRTPLMLLAEGPRGWTNDPERMHLAAYRLLEAGASLLPKDESGRNAAFKAAEAVFYPFFTAMAALGLKAAGRRSSDGYTVLHALCAAAHRAVGEEREAHALLSARILVEACGVDPEARTKIERTARDIAVESGSSLLGAYLRWGVKALADDELGRLMRTSGGAFLHEAAANRSLAAVSALIKLGEPLDEPAREGRFKGYTPLSVAGTHMAIDVIEALINAGADPSARVNEKSPNGELSEGTSAIGAFLWAPNRTSTLPRGLEGRDWKRAASLFFSVPGVVDKPVDSEERTPLQFLCSIADRRMSAAGLPWQETIAMQLLMKGADPNGRLEQGGATPLILAADHAGDASEGLMRMLIDAGANVDACDDKGRTALMAACCAGEPSLAEPLAQLLLDEGADPNITAADGRTALDYAAAAGHDRLVEKLASLIAPTQKEPEAEIKENLVQFSISPVGVRSEASSIKTAVKPSKPAAQGLSFLKTYIPKKSKAKPGIDAKALSSFMELVLPEDMPSVIKTAYAARTAAVCAGPLVPKGEEPRRLAEELEQMGVCAVLDWKCELEDFCFMLEKTSGFKILSDRGIKLPLEGMDEDDEPADWVRIIEEASERAGIPASILNLDCGGDEFVLFTVVRAKKKMLLVAAQAAGLKLGDAVDS